MTLLKTRINNLAREYGIPAHLLIEHLVKNGIAEGLTPTSILTKEQVNCIAMEFGDMNNENIENPGNQNNREIIYQDEFIYIVKAECSADYNITRLKPGGWVVPKGATRFWLHSKSTDAIYSHQNETKWGYKNIFPPKEGKIRAEYCNGNYYYFDLFGNTINKYPVSIAADFNNGFAEISNTGIGTCLMDHNGTFYVKDSKNTLIKLPSDCAGGEMISDEAIAIFDCKRLCLYNRQLEPIKDNGFHITFVSYRPGPTQWSVILTSLRRNSHPLRAKNEDRWYADGDIIYNIHSNTISFKEKTQGKSNNISYSTIQDNCIWITNNVDYIEYDYDRIARASPRRHICYIEEILVFKNGYKLCGKYKIEVLSIHKIILIHGTDYSPVDNVSGCVTFDGEVVASIIYSSISVCNNKLLVTCQDNSYTMTMSGHLIYNEQLLPKDICFFEEVKDNILIVARLAEKSTLSRQFDFTIIDISDMSELTSANYSSMVCHNKEIIVVCQDDKFGVLDKEVNIVVPIVYDSIIFCDNGMLICEKDAKFGVIDRLDNVLLPIKYSKITFEPECGFSVMVDRLDQQQMIGRLQIIDQYTINVDCNLNTVVENDGELVTLTGFYENNGCFVNGHCIVTTDDNKKNIISVSSEILSDTGYNQVKLSEIDDLYIAVKNHQHYLVSVNPFREILVNCEKIWSDDQLAPYKYLYFNSKSGKGVISSVGDIILEGKYSSIRLSYGVFSLEIEDRLGVSDIRGNVLLPCIYRSIERFRNGYIKARNQFVSLFSPNYTEVVSEESNYVAVFETDANCFIVRVKCQNSEFKHGLVSLQGKEIYPPLLTSIFEFVNGEAIFRYAGVCKLYYDSVDGGYKLRSKGGKMGVINELGQIVIEPKYSGIFSVHEGCRIVYIKKDEESYNYGMVDETGSVIIDCKYSFIRNACDGLIVYAQGGVWEQTDPNDKWDMKIDNIELSLRGARWGIMDISGNIIVSPSYDYMSIISEGVAAFKNGDKYGVLDIETKRTRMTEFDYLSSCKEGMFIAGIKNKSGYMMHGYINLNMELVVCCEYNKAYLYNDGIAKVSDYLGEYEINMTGEIINSSYFHEEYSDDTDWGEETWYVMTDGQYGEYPGSGVDYDFLGY